ncbi:MAG: RNA-guided pseudouridylation complex pseudouridine synthase subunit Cbf5 [Nanoarchaeota archaeon]|nr:RNA-guided pseudouridylation complex pseudouridine synthase subunit Cbf5 [Nanoarchaeota archaeon]|tara:strand:+ start:148 stop:1086 length:939 start_codon:yes stop_codon:yes gene_type:complete
MPILIKKQAETDPKLGCKPEEMPIETLLNYGVVNINKSAGPTSHQVSDSVQKILKISKAGHSGTLDPNVTGCLVIALDKATRIVETLLKEGKEYVCLMHLHSEISQKNIKKAFKSFLGKIEQLPPIRSAVKRQLRTREIYDLKILEIDQQDILFRVKCQAGTYIRKLCHDVAKKMGTNGHMAQLVRTKVGPFDDSNWHSLHDLKDAYEFYKEKKPSQLKKMILPIETVIKYLPRIWVFDNCVDTLCHGADLSTPGISKLDDHIQEEDLVAILTLKNELICLGNSLSTSKKIYKNKTGKAVKTTKVFMERKTY